MKTRGTNGVNFSLRSGDDVMGCPNSNSETEKNGQIPLLCKAFPSLTVLLSSYFNMTKLLPISGSQNSLFPSVMFLLFTPTSIKCLDYYHFSDIIWNVICFREDLPDHPIQRSPDLTTIAFLTRTLTKNNLYNFLFNWIG